MALTSSAKDYSYSLQESDANRARVLDFDTIYEQNADYLWNVLRRLGLSETATEDVIQEVFIVVHKKIHTFEGRSSLRTWISGIALRVAKSHRRRQRFTRLFRPLDSGMDVADGSDPDVRIQESEAVRVLDEILDQLDEKRREIFVLSEIEGLSSPEIAEITKTKVNTVYSRLRLARRDFEKALARHQSRDHWRLP